MTILSPSMVYWKGHCFGGSLDDEDGEIYMHSYVPCSNKLYGTVHPSHPSTNTAPYLTNPRDKTSSQQPGWVLSAHTLQSTRSLIVRYRPDYLTWSTRVNIGTAEISRAHTSSHPSHQTNNRSVIVRTVRTVRTVHILSRSWGEWTTFGMIG